MANAWDSATAEDSAAVKAWFDRWGAHVAAREFTEARDLVGAEALGFGTWMDYVEGLDNLEAKQWRSIWGKTRFAPSPWTQPKVSCADSLSTTPAKRSRCRSVKKPSAAS